MRSFVFNGTDFGALTRAKVVSESALCVVPKTADVPGRAGAAVLDVSVPPKVVRLKVWLEPMAKLDVAQLVELRHKLGAALLACEGAELQYQDNYVYHDVLCTKAEVWDTLYEAGSCELEFTCFDPIAYSRAMRTETADTFEVRGTWPTWPIIELVADGSGAITVASADTTTAVTLTGDFTEGSIVFLDYEHETVFVDGVMSGGRIALPSDFSAMRPGMQRFTFEGVSCHGISFYERWV